MTKKKKFNLTNAFSFGFVLFAGSYLFIALCFLIFFFILLGFGVIPEILYGVIFQESWIFRISIIIGIIGFLWGGFEND
tara:strand:- start:289 stop:525 length:237 start_codon:yes stop_codon:yes gene_type:complete